MENFVVSARKYRPATFNTVVGQSSITTTLKNAIRNNHLAQAFLFCGPRGVGKTTCARILAKTINCTSLTKDTEACNECESCKSFNSGQTFNVYELDAASNNSVDDIRNLVDQVRVPPQMGNYKVYIIDEVHMLSAAAFNAFLKTLEEPPKYAIFILATTERHKILPTILSRCQIFNFSRIGVEDIAGHLAYIAKSENVQAEPDALHIIAQKADGALRDACSIFDQLVSFAGNELTYKTVIDNLNILDYDYYFRVTDFLLEENIPGTLLLFDEVLAKGFDGHNFIAGLAEHFRNLLVCKDPQTLDLLEAGKNIRERYKEQSEKCTQSFLLRAIRIANTADVSYRNANNKRLLVEFALMQLTAINSSAPANTGAEKKNDELIIFGTKSAPSAPTLSRSLPQQPVKAPDEKKQNEASTATAEKKILPVENTAAAALKKTTLKTSGSISSFINPQQKKNPETKIVQEIIDRPKELFSQEQLEKAWKAFAALLREKPGRQTDYSIYTMNNPVKAGDDLVTFTVFNKMAEERLNEDKTELMTFLRGQLKNYFFRLEIILSKEEGQQLIYTAQDKFKRLSEINPAIKNLKEKFDLDLDF